MASDSHQLKATGNSEKQKHDVDKMMPRRAIPAGNRVEARQTGC